VFSVKNLGYPLSEDEEKRLFKPYFKNTDPTKAAIESHGIGLSISQ
jgi:signal transduction histidine kinase